MLVIFKLYILMLCKFILLLFNRENVDFEIELENEIKNMLVI